MQLDSKIGLTSKIRKWGEPCCLVIAQVFARGLCSAPSCCVSHLKQMHVYLGDKVVFVQSRGMSTSIPLPLYLSAYDSDQATSGHVWMPMLRQLVLGLAPEKGILYCHRDDDTTLLHSFLLPDPDGLSQAKICEGAELTVWPDENAWEGKFSIWPALHCRAMPWRGPDGTTPGTQSLCFKA